RIRAALPTINWLCEHDARVLCASHLGRPKGQRRPEMSLAPVARRLSALVDRDVPLATDCIGPAVGDLVAELQPGQIGALENLRFHAGETAGDLDFAAELARPVDVFVNDAFGAAHRAHASVVGVPQVLGGGAAGFLMDKELNALGRLLESPERPYAAILGGAKVSDKISLIEKLLERVDLLLIGGAMAYTFLAARGVSVGSSRVEQDQLALANELTRRAGERGVDVLLPIDHVTAEAVDGKQVSALARTDGASIAGGLLGVDIGEQTLAGWKARLGSGLRTVLWNGPVGLFEAAGCDRGTRELAAHLAGLGAAFRVVGGGDTAAAAARFGLEGSFNHVSTGGGAALEFLSGIELPGVAALEQVRQ
ncbi:MAG: phosphoglycerate kinase, partial [Acidobacteriota bacterium]